MIQYGPPKYYIIFTRLIWNIYPSVGFFVVTVIILIYKTLKTDNTSNLTKIKQTYT